MARGKTVLFLLAIAVSTSCAPTENNLNSLKEESGSSENEPPPYHQSPMNVTQVNPRDCQDHHHDKPDVDRDAISLLQNSVDGDERESNPAQEVLPASIYSRNNHQDFHVNHSRLETVGSNSSSSTPTSCQTVHDFNGSNRSSPLNQPFQIEQIIDLFIPALNDTGFSNIISVFLPHSTRSQRIEVPGDVVPENDAVDNSTQDTNPHDRIFFSLLNSFLQSFFGDSTLFQNSNRNVQIGCNFTTQAGYSCSGCREQLLCNPNNIGTIRICPRNNPYCYNGVCGSIVNTTACTTTTTTTG